MCVVCFYIVKAPRLGGTVTHCPTQQVKYVNRIALSKLKALNKGCKLKCAVLLLTQLKGGLKSLKIQHRISS